VKILQRNTKLLGQIWRFISDAATAVSILVWVSLGVSSVIALAISSWAYFGSAPLPAVVVLFLVAFLVLLATTYYLRNLIGWWKNRATRELRERYLEVPPNDDKGLLDFIVEGEQAVQDITKIMASIGKDTNRLRKQIPKYTRRLGRTKNSQKQLKIVATTANAMSTYAHRLDEYNPTLTLVTNILRDSYKHYIMEQNIDSDEDRKSLEEFIISLETGQAEIPTTLNVMSEFRDTTTALKGISGELNGAIIRQTTALGRLIGNLKKMDRAFMELISISKSKAVDGKGTGPQ